MVHELFVTKRPFEKEEGPNLSLETELYFSSSFVNEMKLLVFIDIVCIDLRYIDMYNTDITI